jgi:peptidoglycan hydrolase-like protein with peptidoglycan-binding domain
MAATPGLPSTYDIYHREAVQKALNEKANIQPPLVIDGNFGPASIAALQKFQTANNLTPDGNYGPLTQALLEPFIAQKYALMSDYQNAANALGIPLNVLRAAADTESKSSGFNSDGSCVILFEASKFYGYLVSLKTQAVTNGLMQRYPNIINPTPMTGYYGGIAEWTRENLACTIDQTSAYLSTSWGLFQIMGFNFAACGYGNVQAYVAAMKLSEKNQLTAYVNFIKTYSGGALWKALKNQDFVTYARIYNGPAAVASYSAKMASNLTLYNANPLA